MRHFAILSTLLLLTTSLAYPVTLAQSAPGTNGPDDAVDAAIDTTAYAYGESVGTTMRAYRELNNGTTYAYGETYDTTTQAYVEAMQWALATYGEAAATLGGNYQALVDHGLDAYGLGVDAAQGFHDATMDGADATYAGAVNGTMEGYAYGANVGTGAYATGSYLTEDAYEYAVETTLVVYPEGVATLGDLLRSLGVQTTAAYGLVFNPTALVHWLQDFEEIGDAVTVRAPTPLDAVMQAAMHPLGTEAGAPLSTMSSPLVAPIEPFRMSSGSGHWCQWESAAFSNSRAWSEDYAIPAAEREPKRYDLLRARATQSASYPFGKGCGTEYNAWHSTVAVWGETKYNNPRGWKSAADVYVNLSGARATGVNPVNGEPVTFRFGYGHPSTAPPRAAMGISSPTLFLEHPRRETITPLRAEIEEVMIGGRHLRGDCETVCPLAQAAAALTTLAGKLLKIPQVEYAGQLLSGGAEILYYGSYMTSDYHTTGRLDGVPGAGTTYQRAEAGIEDGTTHLSTRIPFRIESDNLVQKPVWLKVGYWGFWIEDDYRRAVGTDCKSQKKCNFTSGNEVTKIMAYSWNHYTES